MAYPSTTEYNNLKNSTYNSGTNTATNYTVANNEKPVLASKWRGFIRGLQDLMNWSENEAQRVVNKTFRARVFNNASQTFNNGSFTKIQFPTKDYDLNNNWDTTNHRYTAPVSGYYTIHCNIQVLVNGQIILTSYKNGSVYSRYNRQFTTSSTTVGVSANDTIYLSQGDYIEMFAFTSPAGTTESTLGSAGNNLTITFDGF